MKSAYAFAKYFCLLLSIMAAAHAQNPSDARAEMDYYLPEGVSYDPNIPTPEQVLGMVPGEWHVRHDQLVRSTVCRQNVQYGISRVNFFKCTVTAFG